MWAVLFALPGLFTPIAPGVEAQLMRRAKEQRKPTYVLEKGVQVAALCDSIPTSLYIEQLESSLRQRHLAGERLRNLHDAWLSCDVDKYSRLSMIGSLLEAPVFRDVLVLRRNNAWINAFHLAAQSQRRTLIAVGAVHLYGERNVAKLYKERYGGDFSALPIEACASPRH